LKKTIINSLPKSGTNLVAKALELFGYVQQGNLAAYAVNNNTLLAAWWRLRALPFRQGHIIGIDFPVEVSRKYIDTLLRRIGPGNFCTAHLGYTTDLLGKILQDGFSPIVITRDPRAVIVSFVHYVIENRNLALHKFLRRLDNEQRYRIVLQGVTTKHASLQPLRVRIQALASWLDSKQVLRLRFEDIVGHRGGGSSDNQQRELHRLCEWLDIPSGRIDYVAENLYGPGRATFRKGTIDSWRKELPERIIMEVEEQLGDIMKKWKYR